MGIVKRTNRYKIFLIDDTIIMRTNGANVTYSCWQTVGNGGATQSRSGLVRGGLARTGKKGGAGTRGSEADEWGPLAGGHARPAGSVARAVTVGGGVDRWGGGRAWQRRRGPACRLPSLLPAGKSLTGFDREERVGWFMFKKKRGRLVGLVGIQAEADWVRFRD